MAAGPGGVLARKVKGGKLGAGGGVAHIVRWLWPRPLDICECCCFYLVKESQKHPEKKYSLAAGFRFIRTLIFVLFLFFFFSPN